MYNKWYTAENDMENLVQINPVVTVVLVNILHLVVSYKYTEKVKDDLTQ